MKKMMTRIGDMVTAVVTFTIGLVVLVFGAAVYAVDDRAMVKASVKAKRRR